MTRKTLVSLLGSSGSGKTALATAMAEGAKHLIGAQPLQDLMGGRVQVGDSNALTVAWQQGLPLLPLMQEQTADCDCLLLETWNASADLAAQCREEFDVLHVWVLTPGWMVQARLHYRYSRLGDMAAYEHVCQQRASWDGPTGEALLERTCGLLGGCPLLLIDGRDYPLAELDREAAALLLEDGPVQPLTLDPDTPRCQQAVRVGSRWYGKPEMVAFERDRLDAILPAALDGATVLDIGACNGGFSLEAVNRGAAYVASVDIADTGLSELRTIRDRKHLPISTVRMDITQDPLPLCRTHETPQRYSLALLLNVLHRMPDPEATLRVALEASDALVLEAPFCALAYDHAAKDFAPVQPIKPDWARYPGTWHFPPAWVDAVARECRHRVRSIETGPYFGQQRLVWKTERTES